MKLFRKKIKILASNHSDAIIARMVRDGDHSMGFWEYVQELGAKREWSWRENKNFLVFDSEKDYTAFLLKL